MVIKRIAYLTVDKMLLVMNKIDKSTGGCSNWIIRKNNDNIVKRNVHVEAK